MLAMEEPDSAGDWRSRRSRCRTREPACRRSAVGLDADRPVRDAAQEEVPALASDVGDRRAMLPPQFLLDRRRSGRPSRAACIVRVRARLI